MSLFKKNKDRNKVENPYYSLGLLRQTMTADQHDLSVVCQAKAYQIVCQLKSGPLRPLQPVGGGGVRAHPSHPHSLPA